MAPLVNSPTDDHSVATHLTFLREMLMRDYNKRVDDYLFIVGDNCYTNQRLDNLLSVSLVGGASHRLNLAVQNFFREVSDDLDKVKSLMVKLKSLNQSSNLRFKAPLRPLLSQDTRWSSTTCRKSILSARSCRLLRYHSWTRVCTSMDDWIRCLRWYRISVMLLFLRLCTRFILRLRV
ncbi:hypothetical protein PPTG_09163 [Phytophthora nicotianae INRA-310]|uniref:Uncharacterized protein n=1 Tax=Phytophthora nicotianae (strain INRA-310) TaxID=761204 RepID=W2QGJ6_PHYN3|nr:hypothetical protein PPTG_09163 [Phytophthora nicotianae INRA-310]ETN12298.1 hypothetical protein PPTG_09163 [Phytophthora nicotianae INRA-310]